MKKGFQKTLPLHRRRYILPCSGCRHGWDRLGGVLRGACKPSRHICPLDRLNIRCKLPFPHYTSASKNLKPSQEHGQGLNGHCPIQLQYLQLPWPVRFHSSLQFQVQHLGSCPHRCSHLQLQLFHAGSHQWIQHTHGGSSTCFPLGSWPHTWPLQCRCSQEHVSYTCPGTSDRSY